MADWIKSGENPQAAGSISYGIEGQPTITLTSSGNITATGTITSTGATTSGPETVNGSSTLVNGNLDVQTAGFGLRVAEGANAKQGTAVLVAGAVTVANTSVTATSRIFVTSQVDGGAPGFLRVSARVVGASFTITSSSGTDTSTVAYEIIEVG